jgi:hypothetical protein
MSFQFDPRPPNPRDLDYAQLAAGVSPKHDGPETVACTGCGHGARWHSASKPCSHRVGWRRRRCGCSTYE